MKWMGFAIAHSTDCAHISFAIPYFSQNDLLFHIGRYNCRIRYAQLAVDSAGEIIKHATAARKTNDAQVSSAFPSGSVKKPEHVPYEIVRTAMHQHGYHLTGVDSGG